VLARIHMLVRTSPKDSPRYDVRAIEADIAQATRRWEDDFKAALVDAVGEEKAVVLSRAYGSGFPIAYRDQVAARTAVRDVHFIETLTAEAPFAVSLYRPVEGDDRTLRLARLSPRPAHAALREACRSSRTWASRSWTRRTGRSTRRTPVVYLHDFGLRSQRAITDVEAVKPLTEEALRRVMRGEIESDGFNRLTPGAAIAADDVTVLRAYCQVPQAGRLHVQPGLHRADARGASRDRVEDRRVFHCALQPGARGEARGAPEAAHATSFRRASTPCRTRTRTGSSRRVFNLTRATLAHEQLGA
jgi:glutamate dehydrogenase